MYCQNCFKFVNEANPTFCPFCGKSMNGKTVRNVTNARNIFQAESEQLESPKNKWIAFLLCLFLGGLGLHRFYVGKIGTGILWLLTLGCFGFGSIVDCIIIVCGRFKDKDGYILV